MKTYFDKLFEEKGIDLETEIKIDGQINFTLANVIEFCNNCPKELRKKIRNRFIFIDFKNGDIMHFVKYIAKGMVNYQGHTL